VIILFKSDFFMKKSCNKQPLTFFLNIFLWYFGVFFLFLLQLLRGDAGMIFTNLSKEEVER